MNLYVSTTGRENAAGTEADPIARIGEAAWRARPGDVVIVRPGVYREGVWVNRVNGSADAPITFRGDPGAIVEPGSSYGGFAVRVSHVIVDGFEVRGGAYHGIVAEHCHHVTIRNCHSHHNGYSGIASAWAEFIRIEDNECHHNASEGWFSGISLYQNRALDAGGEPLEGVFCSIIRGNVSYDNVTLRGAHTDGNGIIIDDFQSTQTGGFPNYTRPTLVENNLCQRNGGKGIQVTWSDNVTVRRNTCQGNCVDPAKDGTWWAEISISQSRGAKVEKNIAVAVRGPGALAHNRAIDNTSTSSGFNSTTFAGNVGWDAAGTPSQRTDGGNPAPAVPAGIVWTDPQLVGGVPTVALDAGWRPTVAPEPEPEPEPEPDQIKAALDAIHARLAALEATAPEIVKRVASLEAAVAGLAAFDARLKALE